MEFEYGSIGHPFAKELAEIEKISNELIAPLLDKCGLNTCVIHKKLWRNEGEDTIHESWSVAPCNAAEEISVYLDCED